MKRLWRKWKDGSLKLLMQELGWIVSYGKRYSWAVGWYLLLGLSGTAMGLLCSVLGKNIIDIVTGYRYGAIGWVAGAYVGMQLGKIAMSGITDYISQQVQLKVNQSIRKDIFQKIMNARWEEVSQFHSGELLARTTRDAGTVAAGVMGWVPSLIVNSTQFIGAFALMLYYDETLALLSLLTAPAVIGVSGLLSRRMRRHSRQIYEVGADLTSFHAEAFQNIQIIKSFGVVDAQRKKLEQVQAKQKKVTLDFQRFSVFTTSFLSLTGVVVSGLCFFWSVYRLWGGHITYGEMTLFLQLSGTLAGAFGALVGMVPSAISAATAAGRVMELMNLPAEVYEDREQVEQLLEKGSVNVQLQIEDMDFSYLPGNCVFRQVDLQAQPGEVVALVGPSGGGKTTMLRILLGVVNVNKGTVWVESDGLRLNVSPSTRRLFSYVPQDNTLFSGTVAENLRIMQPEATEQDLWNALEQACADGFVKALPQGLDTPVGERGNGLSEGQIQRLSIARALLSSAPVLLLDEATSALDVKTERDILRNITENQKKRTCIVTTHRPSVLEVCHRVYRISREQVTQVDRQEIEQLIQDF